MSVDQGPQDRVPDVVLLSDTLIQDSDGPIGCVRTTCTGAVGLRGVPSYLHASIYFLQFCSGSVHLIGKLLMYTASAHHAHQGAQAQDTDNVLRFW